MRPTSPAFEQLAGLARSGIEAHVLDDAVLDTGGLRGLQQPLRLVQLDGQRLFGEDVFPLSMARINGA